MASETESYFISKMSTVVIVPVDGINLKLKAEQDKIDKIVEKKVKEIVDKLKTTHEKFEDRDFGPTEKDEFGAISFYGNAPPAPAGSKYPAPDTLKWERPMYDDSKFSEGGGEEKGGDAEEEEGEGEEDEYEDEFGFGGGDEDENDIWCKHGKLFLDGTASGDVIQGQLGDCWFLSALAVMGASEKLLEICFWKQDSFKEYGLYVLRFYKDCNVIFVIVDDRLPVKNKDGRLIFAGNKDPNELWVPLIEKAYAKLHGCYKALIGGFTHYGLADMTGFCPRLVVMREGFLGFSEKYTDDDIWQMLTQYKQWKSLMGCSIQSNPKEKHKVEAAAGKGLHMGHAYSLLGLGEIDVSVYDKSVKKGTTEKLVKLRNPWGRGEWEGAYGDRSEEREMHNEQIEAVFNKDERVQEQVEVNFNDGTFLMTFKEWRARFTSLFVAVNFPASWTGKRTQGKWKGDQGGNRDMGTWISNPKVKFRLEPDERTKETHRQVFVGLYIKDSRLSMGFDYYKDPLYATPLAFDIVTEEQLKQTSAAARGSEIKGSSRNADGSGDKVKQPPYNFGTTQVEAYLKVGVDYYIVPSLYKRNQPGTFFLNVYADVTDFHLDGSMTVSDAQKPMVVGEKSDNPVTLKMSVGQYYDKKEQLRERVVSEAHRLGLSAPQLEMKFSDCSTEKMSLSGFKRRMMDMGFMLTDFPDDDMIVLDADNDGTITPKEFIDFFKEGLKFTETTSVAPPPDPPADDLLFKSVDLAGELTVKVSSARHLRQATTWFTSAEVAESTAQIGAAGPGAATAAGGGAGDAKASTAAVGAAAVEVAEKPDPMARRYIKYDPVEAQKLHAAVMAEMDALMKAPLKKRSTSASSEVKSGEDGVNFNDTLRLGDVNTDLKELTYPEDGPDGVLSPPPSVSGGGTSLRGYKPITAANMQRHHHHLGGHGSPPRAGTAAGRTGGTHHDAHTAMTGMSATRREALDKAGAEAAGKLHADPVLQKAELLRTKSLSALRSFKQNQGDGAAAAAKAAESGVMRKRTKGNRSRRRDITKDVDAMQLLNYWPEGVDADQFIDVRKPDVFSPDGKRIGAQFRDIGGDSSSNVRSGTTTFNEAPAVNAADAAAKANEGKPPLMPRLNTRLALEQQQLSSTGKSVGGGGGGVGAGSAGAAGAAGEVLDTKQGRFRVSVPDLWDYLIDCVITISISRPPSAATERHRAVLGMQQQRTISASAFRIFSQPRTPIPAPSRRQTPGKVKKGHIATPRSVRHSPGQASVVSHQSRAKQQSAVLEAKDKLQLLERERGASYEEVYRRLVLVPVTSCPEMEGDRESTSMSGNSIATRSHAYLNNLFQKFDRNLNGFISKDEFKMAMEEMNVEVSAEDCDIFFNRFKCEVPDNIDWKQFLKFFDSQQLGITNLAATKKRTNIIDLIMKMKNILFHTTNQMIEAKVSTLEYFLKHQADQAEHIKNIEQGKACAVDFATASNSNSSNMSNSATPAAGGSKAFSLPDNAIFQNLSTGDAQVKMNVEILRKLGLVLSEEEMARISRIFLCRPSVLMSFARIANPSLDLYAILDVADAEVTRGFSQRTGLATGGPDHTSAVTKLWSSLAPNLASSVSFEGISEYLTMMLLEANCFDAPHGGSAGAAAGAPSTTTAAAVAAAAGRPDILRLSARASNTIAEVSPRLQNVQGSPGPASQQSNMQLHNQAKICAVDANILCRIIADTLCYSSWNRPVASGGGGGGGGGGSMASNQPKAALAGAGVAGGGAAVKAAGKGKGEGNSVPLVNNLSFSGLDAYIRDNRIHYIERKLKYLMQLESNFSGAEVYMMVHVYMSSNQDEFVILAHDPLSGEVHKLGYKEDLKHLPMGEKLIKLFTNGAPHREAYVNRYNPNAAYYYNPWETPAEDRALSGLVARLRIIRTPGSPASLFISEEPKFIQSLKTLLDNSASLPFFCIVNELTMTFETDDQSFVKKGSIRSFVFSKIRNYKSLYNFLVNVHSSLNVVLSTYNGGIRETFKWREMLSHLTNYRNPFFTIQLLPAFLEPQDYIYMPVDDTSAFTGDDDETDLLQKQKSKVDFDGAPHPTWDETFKFRFQPPQLTGCKVLSTEVVKMKIEQQLKYVVVMVREGFREIGSEERPQKESFKFLTIYDPRSATDYQCGVKEGCKLYTEMYGNKLSDGSFQPVEQTKDINAFMEHVEEAAEKNKFILGPAITPRLEVNVYNENGRSQELLGTCQVSISSVLSGSGIGEKQWICLTYRLDAGSGREIDAAAGDIEIEMRFRGQMEIDAEKESEEQRIAKIRKKQEAGYQDEPEPGDQDPPLGGSLLRGGGGAVGKKQATAELKNQLKDNEGQLDSLREENETLQRKIKVLNEKQAKAEERLTEYSLGGENAALSAELKTAHEEMEKLAVEKTAAENERLKLQQELTQLKEESAKDIAGLKETAMKAQAIAAEAQEQQQHQGAGGGGGGSARLLHEDTPVRAAAGADPRDSEDFLRLQADFEKLHQEVMWLKESEAAARREMEQAQEEAAAEREKRKREQQQSASHSAAGGGEGSSSGTLPALQPAAVPATVTTTAVGGGGVRIDDDTVLGTVHGILQVLLARHERKGGSHGNPLLSFHHLLNSYAKADSSVTHKDLITALSDLMIEISTEQGMKIFREIGVTARQQKVLVSSIMEYFKSELGPLQQQMRRQSQSQTLSSSASSSITGAGAGAGNRAARLAASGEVHTSADESKLDAKSKTLPARPSQRPSSAQVARPGPAAGAGARLRSTHHGHHQPQEQQQQQQQQREHSRSSGNLNATSGSEEGGAATAGGSLSGVSSAGPATPSQQHQHPQAAVDWSQVPLPDGWGRRWHSESNRWVYLHHVSKRTQWNHPSDLSKQHRKRKSG